jgi:hypothetical protein
MLCLVLVPISALAAPPTVRPEVTTTAPLAVGAGVLVEAGPRLRVATQIGVLPGPYVDGITTAIGALEPSWTPEASALVEAALGPSAIWRTEAGWRPLPKLGLYGHGTYALAGLGGSATAAEIVEAALGSPLPVQGLGRELEFDARATLHLLGVEVGWDQRLWRGLHLRAGLGWAFTVAASADIAAPDEVRRLGQRAVAEAEAEAGAWLGEVLRSYAHPPTVTVAVGWAFGG